ncbi:MAG: DUF2071 domain-containing protein [Proteobacteria bacterium]|nr:DUF2071 domain-containing protein [Pseudomonadota bacterium]
MIKNDKNSPLNTNHRPWPVPNSPWLFRMRWTQLLFAHFPVDPKILAPFIPEGLSLQLFDGVAWVAIVPFVMENTAPRGIPAVPGVSKFLELNVRTYVVPSGKINDSMETAKPGVFFFSLDANSKFAVRAARKFFHLPYMDAHMSLSVDDKNNGINYNSHRFHKGQHPCVLDVSYHASSEELLKDKSEFEIWASERYCLYSVDHKGQVWRGEIDHDPWPLQTATVEIRKNTMFDQLPIKPLSDAPICHFSRSIDVRGWYISKVT